MGYSFGVPILTDGLTLCLDASDKNCYPGSGTTWSDLAGFNNGTLTNGPTFSSDNRGAIEFDGTNDFVDFENSKAMDGIEDTMAGSGFALRKYMKESPEFSAQKWRYDGPPEVTSVYPGRSNVQCKFVACLDSP